MSLNFTESSIDSSASRRFNSTRWLVVNESAGGMALSKFPGASSVLGVGELLGIRGDRSHQWALGVVRWANGGENADLEVGAQMLAPSARPVALRDGHGGAFVKALLLPEMPLLHLPVTLLAPCGTYAPARKLELLLQTDDKVEQVLVTRLVERTACFERFQFAVHN